MTFDKIIGLLSLPLTLVVVIGIARQVNKNQRVTPGSSLIGLVMAPVTLIINLIFMAQAIPTLVGPLLLVLGLGFGLAWGFTTRLRLSEGLVVARQSILHLVFWAISVTVTQLLAAFAPSSWVAGGLATMFFSTGTTVGSHLNLLGRQLLLGRKTRQAAEPPVPAAAKTPVVMSKAELPQSLPEKKRPTSLPK